jgi:hypothetical protein
MKYSVDTGCPARLYAFSKKELKVIKKVDPITLITEPVTRHHQVTSRAPRKIVSELINPELASSHILVSEIFGLISCTMFPEPKFTLFPKRQSYFHNKSPPQK